MLAKRIIPCLDVDRGRVVKGTNFLNLRDAGDPVAEVGVALRHLEEFAHNEERPALADDVECLRHAAPLAVGLHFGSA